MESDSLENKQKIVIPWYLKIVFMTLLGVLIVEGFLFLRYNNSQTFSLRQNRYNLAIDQEVAKDVLSKITLGQTPRSRFFVWDTKTWHDNVKNVEIEFVDIPQPYGTVMEGSDPGKFLSSFNNGYKNNKLFLKVQVADSLVNQDSSGLVSIYTDAIMRAFFLSKNPDYITNEESQKNLNIAIKNQVESGQPLLIPSNANFFDKVIEQARDFISFLKPGSFTVKAVGCYGTYECGTWMSTTTKLGCYTDEGVRLGDCGAYSCSSSCRVGTSFGTCICQTSTWCDATGSDAQPCGGNASSCTGSRCGTSGSCTYSNSCTWDSGGGPVPTPTPTAPPPGPTPPPTGMTMHVTIGLDKNRNGIFDDGYYQVIEDPVDTNCGTFPNISGLTVSYSGAATGVIDYHTNCAGGTYNYPYSAKGILATGNFTFTLNNLPSNYSLKWIEESSGKCTLSGGVVTCTGLANGQTYSLWFFIQESGVANCKNLTGPSSLYVGETGTFTATYEAGTGPITDRGLAIYREGQCEPNTPAYWNKIAGAAGTQSFNWVPSAAGIYDVDCRAWNDGITECRGRCFGPPPYQCAGPTTTRKVTVLSPVSAWWQVKDSDLLAFGDLDSSVPTSLYFNLVGGGGFPGVPVYSGSTNLTSTNVSVKKWLAKTYFSSKIFNFGSSYFINSIPSAATINNISSSAVPGSYFASGGTAYNGYYWYVYDGNANGGFNLTITSAAALGSRKVILIVKNAGLNIEGNINLTKGSGFFLTVTTGNIVVTPNVGGGASANLEGIYVADGTFFSTKWGDKNDERLWVRGTVAAYGGIDLQRNLGSTNNSTTPAEFFEYAPELELLFPIELSNRLTNWREVAP